MIQNVNIEGKDVLLYGVPDAEICILQLINEHEIESVEDEIIQIKKESDNKSIVFVGLVIKNSNYSLSPWKAPAVFKKEEDFGDGAQETLSYILKKLLPEVESIYNLEKNTQYIIGGYSLSGLFALWSGYQTDKFTGIAAASPSVWFHKWDEFLSVNKIQSKKVYLSLGIKEKKTRNPLMTKVAERIRSQSDILISQIGSENCILEWNPGNHFTDTDKRMTKAFSWIVTQLKK